MILGIGNRKPRRSVARADCIVKEEFVLGCMQDEVLVKSLSASGDNQTDD